jgi:hypothetical protein
MRSIILAFAAMAFCGCSSAQPAPSGPPSPTVVISAADSIFDAFHRHPLVGLSDDHGSVLGGEFYNALIRDPRFARDVGNVVVEFGSSNYQDVMDRYVAGEPVPYLDLRQVWTNTVGWNPNAGYSSHANFFAEVRAVNRTLPPDQRIRIWLGEPPVDWTKVETRKHYDEIAEGRDSYPAGFIVKEILDKKKKALVIYGGAHFFTLGAMVERKRPGSFYFIDAASSEKSCDPMRSKAKAVWPTPALAAPAGGGSPDADLRPCALASSWTGKVAHDAVLFFGLPESLKIAPFLPDIYLDASYRQEVSRWARIKHGEGLGVRSASFPIRRIAYRDLDAPGWKEAMDAMFGRYDADGNGEVSEQEYRKLAAQ